MFPFVRTNALEACFIEAKSYSLRVGFRFILDQTIPCNYGDDEAGQWARHHGHLHLRNKLIDFKCQSVCY